MIDPLQGFNWQTLYQNYDVLCARFNSLSPYLRTLKCRPNSDRELYYSLSKKIRSEIAAGNISLRTYEALLYWKLYSQPVAKRIFDQIEKDPGAIQSQLTSLSKSLPNSMNNDKIIILKWIRYLDNYKIPGIKSSDALPCRTTLLHMLYPNVVPIFDKQVLKAVGGWNRKHANKSIKCFENYLDYIWKLVKLHFYELPSSARETPLRLIDMALWVIRGGCKRNC